MTLVDTSYADHLQFIKNKAHSDSLKTPSKLHDKLDTSEINQIANSITQTPDQRFVKLGPVKKIIQLITTIIILVIIISWSSRGYKAFKRSDFYKGTDTYKKELKLKQEGKQKLLMRFKELQKNK